MDSLIVFVCPLLVLCTTLLPMPPEITHHTKKVVVEPGGNPVTVPVQVNVSIKPHIEPQNIFKPGNTINNDNTGAASIAQSKSSATNSTYNNITTKITQIVQQLARLDHRAMAQATTEWVRLRKKQLALYGAGLSYGSISLILIRGNHFMRHHANWAHWKNDCTMETLLEIPQQRLENELIHAIEQRYLNRKSPTDHLTPLICFLTAIEQEVQLLNRYLLIARALRRSKLLWAFPTNHQNIEQAQHLKERLGFIKHTFISWAATDNIAKFNH